MTHRGVKLILASGSPQRRALLTEAGYEFTVIEPSPRAECGVCSRETPGELVSRLARQKAADVVERIERAGAAVDVGGESIVLGCDTVAECQGQILGKPADVRHAGQMLRLLSGREHRVYSGLCLWPLGHATPQVRLERTTLRMDELAEAQIDEYLSSGAWQGKAGAFGYQDRVGWLHIVSGSASNVVGLPLELLGEMLTKMAEGDPADECPPDRA